MRTNPAEGAIVSPAELSDAPEKLIQDLRSVLDDILSEREVVFFALFLREDADNKWDLVVCGESFDKTTTLKAVEYVVEKLRSRLGDAELLQLSRVVIMKADDPAFQAISSAINLERGRFEVQDCVFSGVKIRHAVIMRAARAKAAEIH